MKRKNILILLIAVLAIMLLPVNMMKANASDLTDQGIIRVKLSSGDSGSTTVKSYGNYVLSQNSSIVLTQGKAYTICTDGTNVSLKNDSGTVLYTGSTVTLKQYNLDSSSNYIYVYNDAYGNLKYQGDFVFKADGSDLGVYNYINLEKYVEGVIAYEMSNNWPLEALKAQAIAARSYAYSDMLTTNGAGDYDVVDTTSSQVYKGYNSSFTNVQAAVQATSKQVLYWNGKVAKTFFSASNGGQTELAGNVWGGGSTKDAAYGYLQMKLDEYDLRSTTSPTNEAYLPKTNDKTTSDNTMNAALETYLKQQLSSYLLNTYGDKYSTNTADITIKGVSAVVPNTQKYPSCSESIYYTKVKFTLNVNAKIVVSGQVTSDSDDLTIDLNLDAPTVRNSFYSGSVICLMPTVEETTTGYNLVYRRWGHGIGLSQDGAYQMAKENKSYTDILNFYFKDIQYVTLTYPDFSIPQSYDMPDPSQIGGDLLENGVVKVINCSSAVNVRSGPGTSYSSIGTAALNSQWGAWRMNVPGTDGKLWYQICYSNNQVGYIRSDYIQLVSGTIKSPVTGNWTGGDALAGGTVEVTTTTAAVKSGANAGCSTIATVNQGTQWGAWWKDVVSADDGTKWYQICYLNNVVGYISSDSVKLVSGHVLGEWTGGDALVSGTVEVTSATAAVKSGANAGCSTIATVNQGTQWGAWWKDVVSADDGSKWYQICYLNNVVGYISSDSVSLVGGHMLGEWTGGDALAGGMVEVTTTTAAVKSGANANCSTIATVNKGTQWGAWWKDVVSKDDGSKWYQICYLNNVVGYISSDSVSLVGGHVFGDWTGGQELVSGVVKVTSATAAVKSGANANCSTIATVNKDTQWGAWWKDVVSADDGSKWYQICYLNNVVGYISSDSVSLVGGYVKGTVTGKWTGGEELIGGVVKITSTTAAVKSGANANCSTIATVNKDTQWGAWWKDVVSADDGSKWYQICYLNNVVGYISSDSVSLVGGYVKGTVTGKWTGGEELIGGVVKITSTTAAVKSGANANCSTIATVNKDTQWGAWWKDVVSADDGSKWYQICYLNNVVGYISSDSVSLVGGYVKGTVTGKWTGGEELGLGVVQVTSTTAAVKSGANVNCSTIATVNKDTQWGAWWKDVVSADDGSKWYQICYLNGVVGYISSDSVKLVSGYINSSTGSIPLINGLVKVTKTATIRSGPGTSYSSLGTAAVGTQWGAWWKNVTGTDGKYWYQICYFNNVVGYIQSDYAEQIR